MEAAIIAVLLADSGVAALVGTRVQPVSRPQSDTFPAVTVTRISGGPEYADDGEVGLEDGRIQIDCHGLTYTDAKGLAVAVRNCLSALIDTTSAGVFIIYVTLDNERDFRESGSNAAEYSFRTAIDFMVWIGEQ